MRGEKSLAKALLAAGAGCFAVIVLFVISELMLRWFGLAKLYSLIPGEQQESEYLSVQPILPVDTIKWRYQRPPIAPADLRVVCFGESATAGIPFDSRASFCALTGRILSRMYPTKRIQFINAGQPGAVSLEVFRIFQESASLQADAAITYFGHNDQNRSMRSLRARFIHYPLLWKFYSRVLTRSYVFNYLSHEISRFKGVEIETFDEYLLGANEYEVTEKVVSGFFRSVMEAIQREARHRGIAWFYASVVQGIDHFPLSPEAPSPDPDKKIALSADVERARALYFQGAFSEAAGVLREVVRTEPRYLYAKRLLGRTYQKLGKENLSAALYQEIFDSADNIESMRGRNNILRERAELGEYGTFVDLFPLIRGRFPSGFLTGLSMLDVCHLGPTGNMLLAEVFSATMLKDPVVQRKLANEAPSISHEEAAKLVAHEISGPEFLQQMRVATGYRFAAALAYVNRDFEIAAEFFAESGRIFNSEEAKLGLMLSICGMGKRGPVPSSGFRNQVTKLLESIFNSPDELKHAKSIAGGCLS